MTVLEANANSNVAALRTEMCDESYRGLMSSHAPVCNSG